MKKTMLAVMLGSIMAVNSVQAVENQLKNVNESVVPMAQLPTVEAELTFAPNVPKPIERTTPAKVVVKLEALEKVMEIESGVKFKYWTFNGTTPAPFIRVREGDMVEVQLSNPVAKCHIRLISILQRLPKAVHLLAKPHQVKAPFLPFEQLHQGFISTIAAQCPLGFTSARECSA